MSTTQQKHPGYKPLVDVVGINASGNGRSCEEHRCCGRYVIAIDVVLRLRSVQVKIDGVEKPAIAAYWVTDGIDRCRVGFLKAKIAEREGLREEYDGRLVQVVSILNKNSESSQDRAAVRRYFGCCQAAFIEVERMKPTNKILDENNNEGERHKAPLAMKRKREDSGRENCLEESSDDEDGKI